MEKIKVVKNAAWLVGMQILRAAISLIISILTARYLGPSDFGLINYAASIVAFVTPVMYLGLNGVLVQELVLTPEKEGEILGTAITLSFISSFLCIGGVLAFTLIANAGETITIVVCVLYSILLIFQSVEMIIYWFQAKLLSKYSSVASFAAYFIVSLYKVFLLVTGKGVYWFAVSNAIDYLLLAIFLFIIYKKQGGKKFSFSSKRAKNMLRKSKFYILSNIMITVFAQTDRIMLKLMIDDAATGYYSAAATCAGMTGFVFTAIIDSLRPYIFEKKAENEEVYENGIICLYSIVIYFSLIQSIVFTAAAPLFIRLLYGGDYLPSISVLRIINWYCTFSYLGGARDIWILAEGKQKYLILINLVGAVINVVLNYFLIPKLQASGAAIATVITQFAINIVFVSIFKPTRRNGLLQLKAINPKYIFKFFKKKTEAEEKR